MSSPVLDELYALRKSNKELLHVLEFSHRHFIQNNKLTIEDREMLDEMWVTIKRETYGGTVQAAPEPQRRWEGK